MWKFQITPNPHRGLGNRSIIANELQKIASFLDSNQRCHNLISKRFMLSGVPMSQTNGALSRVALQCTKLPTLIVYSREQWNGQFLQMLLKPCSSFHMPSPTDVSQSMSPKVDWASGPYCVSYTLRLSPHASTASAAIKTSKFKAAWVRRACYWWCTGFRRIKPTAIRPCTGRWEATLLH